MGESTNISWCHHTFNIAWGCVQISPACAHCYAKTLAERWGLDVWGEDAERRTFGEKHWAEPLKWNAKAKAANERRRVFCSSMADVFEDHPTINQERANLWPLIRATDSLDWLLLTKRPENIERNLPDDWESGYPNVWLGVTAENQEFADKRIPVLLDVPARVRFVSVEPLLGHLFIDGYLLPELSDDQTSVLQDGLDWVILGGESGAHHRPFNVDWAREIRDGCRAACTPFFFKQHGGRTPDAGGCLLDGREWKEFPATA